MCLVLVYFQPIGKINIKIGLRMVVEQDASQKQTVLL